MSKRELFTEAEIDLEWRQTVEQYRHEESEKMEQVKVFMQKHGTKVLAGAAGLLVAIAASNTLRSLHLSGEPQEGVGTAMGTELVVQQEAQQQQANFIEEAYAIVQSSRPFSISQGQVVLLGQAYVVPGLTDASQNSPNGQMHGDTSSGTVTVTTAMFPEAVKAAAQIVIQQQTELERQYIAADFASKLKLAKTNANHICHGISVSLCVKEKMMPGYEVARSDGQLKGDTVAIASANNMLRALSYLQDGQEFAPPNYSPQVLALAIALESEAEDILLERSPDSFAAIKRQAMEIEEGLGE